MKLRIPYLLAAVVATASFFSLADTRSLKAAPLVSVKTISGQSVDLAEPLGKTRLLTFWAPDCPISERNIPALSRLHERFSSQQFEILAIAMPYSTPSDVDLYIENHSVSYPVAIDRSGEVSEAFPGVRFTPTTYLIDSNNNIVWKHVGRMTTEQAAAQILLKLEPQQLAKH